MYHLNETSATLLTAHLIHVFHLSQNPQHLIKDLHFAVASPELLPQLNNPLFPCQDFSNHLRTLTCERGQEQNPIQDFFSHYPEKMKLGRYFELLWAYFFSTHPDFTILASNLQLINEDKITLGELDFVLSHPPSGCTWHLEVCVKFYLQVDLDGHPTPWLGFIGPGCKDQLRHKYQRLLTHQLKLSSQPVVIDLLQQKGIPKLQSHAICKGRLFYSGPSTYRWYRYDQAINSTATKNKSYLLLDQEDWLAPQVDATRAKNLCSFEQSFNCHQAKAQLFTYFPYDGDNNPLLFIVNEAWVNLANKALKNQ